MVLSMLIASRRPLQRRLTWAVLLGIVFVMGGVWPGAVLAASETGNAYTALTAGFREGDFGTSINNELYTLTPEFGYVGDSFDFSAAIPFHNLAASGGGLSSSESGMGDAVLRGGRRLWRDEQSKFSISGALKFKLATGDESKGLGTGAMDVGISLTGTRSVGAYGYTILAGYTQVGEPADVNYDNVVSYGIGANRSFTRTNVFASLQGQTSALQGGTDPLEFDVGFFRMLSLDYVVIAHAFVGLSDGSPNDGMGIGVVRWWR
jgi:hypothetical protein